MCHACDMFATLIHTPMRISNQFSLATSAMSLWWWYCCSWDLRLLPQNAAQMIFSVIVSIIVVATTLTHVHDYLWAVAAYADWRVPSARLRARLYSMQSRCEPHLIVRWRMIYDCGSHACENCAVAAVSWLEFSITMGFCSICFVFKLTDRNKCRADISELYIRIRMYMQTKPTIYNYYNTHSVHLHFAHAAATR